MISSKRITTISEYIDSFPKEVQKILRKLRGAVKESAPNAQEKISYQMPTFEINGKNLVHFAAYKEHIGFYPTPSAITAFKKELSKYKQSKGAVRFPINKPLPLLLLKKIVKYRVNEETLIRRSLIK